MADPVFVKDRRHRVLFANAAFLRFIGGPRERILGCDERHYASPEQRKIFHRRDNLVFAGKRDEAREELMTDAHGVTHVIVTRKTLCRDAAGRAYLVGVIRDVTAQSAAAAQAKHNLEALRRAQKLETIGRLAAGVAHDFNNMLTAIIGSANLALEALPEGHAAREEVLELRRVGERAASLTRGLLSFSRRAAARPRRADLREIFNGMRPMLQRLLPSRVSLQAALPETLPPVRLDPGRAEQVFLNLVVNAGDAIGGVGRVLVELADAPRGGGGLPGPCVLLTVSDNGEGMDAGTKAAMFEPLFSTKPQGAGLGLASVRDALRADGGALEVDSTPGRGTRVRVFWPAADGCGRAAVRRDDSMRRAVRRARVLVIEDDEAVRRFVVRCLARAGYETVEAEDGVSAIERADRRGFDAAVVDVVLPRLQGPQAVERLRERWPRLKVLFVSGQASPALARGGAPKVDFLPKPFDAALLTERVAALLRSRV